MSARSPVTGHGSRAAIMAVALVAALASAASPGRAVERAYGGEDRDWKVAPTNTLRTADYSAPTPREIPGGRVVTLVELKALLAREPQPYLIDVLGGAPHRTAAGAFWLPGAGAGDMTPEEERRFDKALASFAAGDRSRPIVFFCSDARCWLSYNAALRAIQAGYTNIMWFRGGIAAWLHAGLPMKMSEPFAW